MTDNQKQELIDDMLFTYQNREHDFAIIDDCGMFKIPIQNSKGIVVTHEPQVDGYRGIALEINDHGNVTVWSVFKNGNKREIASRV